MAGRRGKKFEFYGCPCWRYKHRVTRSPRGIRPRGHLKRIWCPLCKAFRIMKKLND